MCGERECVDKKEANEYFEKHLSFEIKISKKKEEKVFDLVKLNLSSSKTNEKIKFKNLDKEKLSKLEKKRIKEEKKLVKLRIREKREKIKKEKKLLKVKKKKEEKKSIVKKFNKSKLEKNKKTKKNIKKIKKDNKFCFLPKECDIDEISKYLKKIGEEKDYPKLSKR